VPTTAPNDTADISVSLVAPSAPGTYQSYWRMRNASGEFFGPTIWILIVVPALGTTDGATFVSDVTVPGNTQVAAGQPFIKTWRMRNTGDSTWSGYSWAFVSGLRLGGQSPASVPATAPGATTDIAVPMVAPSAPGTYQGYWRMRNAAKQFFGPTIWVLIVVFGPPSGGATVQFSASQYRVSEADGQFDVRVTRTGNSSETATVLVTPTDGTASPGVDFQPFATTLTFPPGVTQQTFPVVLVQNPLPQGDRGIRLLLSEPSHAAIGRRGSAILTIEDDGHQATPGRIGLSGLGCESQTGCAGSHLTESGEPKTDPNDLVTADVQRAGVIADGVSTLVIKIASSTPQTLTLEPERPAASGRDWGVLQSIDGIQAGQTITVAPVSTTEGMVVLALYRAPADFPLSTVQTAASVRDAKVQLLVGSGPNPSRKRILVRRPPLVLVHGIWSDASAWKALEDDLRPLGFDVCDGCRIDYGLVAPAGSFDPTHESYVIAQLHAGVQRALESARAGDGPYYDPTYGARPLAATQVDVITHSLGGLVARARVQYMTPPLTFDRDTGPYKRQENYGSGDFNRLITVGTPHRGTLFADWLVLHRDYATTVVENLYGPIYVARTRTLQEYLDNYTFLREDRLGPIGPAVVQMRVNSSALQNIGSTDVPTHVISAQAPASSVVQSWVLERTISKFCDDPAPTLNSILGTQHDTIVRVQSQEAGFPAGSQAVTSLSGIVHASGKKCIRGVCVGTDPRLATVTCSTRSRQYCGRVFQKPFSRRCRGQPGAVALRPAPRGTRLRATAGHQSNSQLSVPSQRQWCCRAHCASCL